MSKWKPEKNDLYYCECKIIDTNCGRPATWRLGYDKTWSCDEHLVKMMRKSFEAKP